MWVIDAIAYLLRGIDARFVLAPCILLSFAWLQWLRGPRPPASFRTLSLLGALISGTIAVATYLALMVWWGGIFQWLHPHVAFCATSWWGDLGAFFGTAGCVALAPLGRGPGKIFTVLAAITLVILRASIWYL